MKQHCGAHSNAQSAMIRNCWSANSADSSASSIFVECTGDGLWFFSRKLTEFSIYIASFRNRLAQMKNCLESRCTNTNSITRCGRKKTVRKLVAQNPNKSVWTEEGTSSFKTFDRLSKSSKITALFKKAVLEKSSSLPPRDESVSNGRERLHRVNL